MQLQLVFLSALVLIAYGKDIPSNGEDEVMAGYVGQEADDVGPQGVLAAEAPAVRGVEDEAASSPQDLQSTYAVEEPTAERVPTPESGIYIPVVMRICTNAACAKVCQQLGFKNGFCVSLDTCWCFN